jgi:hypothetical protein
MTTQAIPAPHVAVSIPSIPPRTALALDDGDVSVTATFRPRDPIGSTEVVASVALPDDAALLTLLDATIARLTAYRDTYQQAMAANDQPVMDDKDAAPVPARAPLPLPVPWYAW